MEIRFTVGEMANINGISKQMLIYYDREGIFKPKYVDAHNGYRYYSGDQLEQLVSILMLREMGFSLNEIKHHLKHRTAENSLTLLKTQLEAVHKKIQRYKLMEQRLTHKIQSLEDYHTSDKQHTHFINLDAQYLLISPVLEPKGLLQVDVTFKGLLKQATDEDLPHSYQIGDMISLEHVQNKNYLYYHYAFLPLTKKVKRKNIHKKPAGTYARIYHLGTYQDIGATYQLLLHDLSKNGYRPTGYAYEYCVFDSLTSKTTEDYITEIQVQVLT